MRRDFLLPEEDRDYLDALGLPWETITDDKNQWCIQRQVPYPAGLNHSAGSIAIRVPSGYLTTGLDMAYFLPHLRLANGREIDRANVFETICGEQWQRWSRHYPWHGGLDTLASHLLQVNQWLKEEARRN